jgi:hypothetical protein
MVRPRPIVMSVERFTEGLKALGYNISTANSLLGIGRTSLYRISKGGAPVPMVVAKLMDMYERHGIPEEHR